MAINTAIKRDRQLEFVGERLLVGRPCVQETLLAAVFLRSVGVVGHIDPPKNEDRGDEKMYDARKASDEVPCTPKFKGLG